MPVSAMKSMCPTTSLTTLGAAAIAGKKAYPAALSIKGKIPMPDRQACTSHNVAADSAFGTITPPGEGN
ncbi:hypothetical protein D3C87_1738310 [compost metagenome]